MSEFWAPVDPDALVSQLAKQAEKLKAVHLRHVNVHQDDVGRQLARFLDGFVAIGGFADDTVSESNQPGQPHDEH